MLVALIINHVLNYEWLTCRVQVKLLMVIFLRTVLMGLERNGAVLEQFACVLRTIFVSISYRLFDLWIGQVPRLGQRWLTLAPYVLRDLVNLMNCLYHFCLLADFHGFVAVLEEFFDASVRASWNFGPALARSLVAIRSRLLPLQGTQINRPAPRC